jgi:hypothetical protein
LQERSEAGLPYRIVRDGRQEHANVLHRALLRARNAWPSGRGTNKRDEFATLQCKLHPLPQSQRQSITDW